MKQVDLIICWKQRKLLLRGSIVNDMNLLINILSLI